MKSPGKYAPGPAAGAHVEKAGDAWTLVLVRDLRHPPERVWDALTDPAHLAKWAPFDADRNMATTGPIKLSTIGAPMVTDTTVRRAEPPRLLEYTWGGGDMRWALEPVGEGTRLTLWAQIDKNYIAWGAAGWHICLDVLDHLLAGDPVGRIAGPEAMKHAGWGPLVGQYKKQFAEEA